MSLGRKSGIQANGNISVNRSKNGVTIERKDKRTSITLKNVALENLLKRQTDRERDQFHRFVRKVKSRHDRYFIIINIFEDKTGV